MNPLEVATGAVLGPIAGPTALSFGNSALSYYGTKKTNEMNRDMAREQMRFQERMSSTAYQRSMDDMKKAGLNPILAYSQGGASNPAGSSAQMQKQIPENSLPDVLTIAQQILNLKNTQATTAQTEANTTKTEADTIKSLNEAERIKNTNKPLDAVGDAIDTGRGILDYLGGQMGHSAYETKKVIDKVQNMNREAGQKIINQFKGNNPNVYKKRKRQRR